MARRKVDKVGEEAVWRRGGESRVFQGVISAVRMEQCALRCSLLLFSAFFQSSVIFDKVF